MTLWRSEIGAKDLEVNILDIEFIIAKKVPNSHANELGDLANFIATRHRWSNHTWM